MTSMDVPRWMDDVISRARFAPYLAATGGDVDAALRMYARNAEIAAAFVYPLHHVEVALRNRLDRRLAEHYGSTTWWTAAPLSPAGQHMIAEAKSGGGTHAGRAPVPGDIVAALNFGFWVSLLGSRYHRTLCGCPHCGSSFRAPPAATSIETSTRSGCSATA